MTNDLINIGFIGAGGNTRLRHLPGFKDIEGVTLASVANRSRESGQKVADEFGIGKVYDDWKELLQGSDSNAICIGTWPYMHCQLVVEALAAGKHVLTEARMAMNSKEARAMLIASLASPNLIAQVVPSPMTLGVDKKINQLIAEGYLGDILSVDLVISQGGFKETESSFHWRYDRDISGNNIMTMGIWYEGIMRWLGPAESVTSINRIHVKSRVDEAGINRHIDVPDHVEILCEMASGPVMRMRLSSITGLGPADGVWLFGTEGTLFLKGPSRATRTPASLTGGRRGDSELTPIEIPADQQGAWRVEEEFINAIRGIEPVTHTSFFDGLKYMEFTDAVTISAQTGQKVRLPLI